MSRIHVPPDTRTKPESRQLVRIPEVASNSSQSRARHRCRPPTRRLVRPWCGPARQRKHEVRAPPTACARARGRSAVVCPLPVKVCPLAAARASCCTARPRRARDAQGWCWQRRHASHTLGVPQVAALASNIRISCKWTNALSRDPNRAGGQAEPRGLRIAGLNDGCTCSIGCPDGNAVRAGDCGRYGRGCGGDMRI